ncbi:MAG: hypothetical protein NW200_02765 [Hyphomonadaceae bacterium]|nr:hypothetical protein [Hyphomonadaceae bacterium]
MPFSLCGADVSGRRLSRTLRTCTLRTWALRALAALAVGAFCILPAPASAQTWVMRYEGVAYGVLEFGRARVEATVADGRYTARGELDTSALAALFAKAQARATAHGALTRADARPSTYDLLHVYRGVRRTWRVDWSTPKVEVKTSPDFPFTSEVPPTEAQRREGRDPLSTIIAMGRAVTDTGRCGGVFRVHDGLYVYDMTLRDIGAGRYRENDIDWPVVRCAIRQKRVAGYLRRADLDKELPEGEIWFATPPGAPFAVLARFSSRLPLGAATISLTQATRS